MTTPQLALRRVASTCTTIPIRQMYSALPCQFITNNLTATTTNSATNTTRRALSSEEIKTNSEWKKSGDKTKGVYSQTSSPYTLGKHRSNALSLLQKQEVIEVEGDMAVCDGGGGALGHPLEYIKLGARQDIGEGSEAEGIRCLYCGLRYRSKGGGGHH
eukprot:CAMPEP_0198251016 /NCGR_PEP_ID=MMETSP1447-20131203/1992_1 /TAXON_ID=420782 /ORGANISM="Chaetoceros dichaeta, Strain CCMP1751" /LENGTH=158 /DNA_ID=CAMNT_0043935947 /DNA_START=95 /DNA_END=571 /DNA_ORIENTATION=+